MTHFKYHRHPSGSFNNLMDDLLATVPSLIREEFPNSRKQFVPVNIKETGTAYLLEVIAPGFEKEDFRINLDKNTLTVSGEKKEEEKNESDKQIRKEYRFQSFKRSFTIDEKINAEEIAAKYINGVLTLNLPKKTEVKTSAKQITIQ